MFTFLLVLLVIDCFLLIGVVLLQSGKGSGLAANFGGASSTAESLIGSRQAGNLLTKLSWWMGGVFVALSFVLQIAGSRQRTPRSVLDRAVSAPPATAPAAPLGTVPSGAAPASPLIPAPAPTTVPSTPRAPAPKP